MDQNIFHTRLQEITETVKKKAFSANGIGLWNGKGGIMLFLFYYARFAGDKSTGDFAKDLFRRSLEEIKPDTSPKYGDGLLGYAHLIEHLVHQEYIEIENVLFPEFLDKRLNGMLENSSDIQLNPGIVGIGNYLADRIKGGRSRGEDTSLNERSLATLSRCLDKPYHSYPLAFGALHLMNSIYPFVDDKYKIKTYMDYAVDKVETMVYEDMHFDSYPGFFNPLIIAYLLLKTAHVTAQQVYKEKATFFLKQYESGFSAYLPHNTYGMKGGRSKWGYLYNELGRIYNNNKYTQNAADCLSFVKDNAFLNNLNGEPGLLNGYAGVGMALLAVAGSGGDKIDQLLPF